MYVPLRTHGWHSLLTGVDPPEALLERAGELGLPALALTDVDTLAGSTHFLRAAERLGGPRPILGAELSDPAGRPGRVVALVRDERGYASLCRLVSARALGDDPGAEGARLEGPEAFDLALAAARFQEGLTLCVDHPWLAFALAERVPRERLLVAVSPAALARRAAARDARRARPTHAPPPPEGERTPATPGAAPKVPPPARAAAAGELVATARALGLATLAVPDVYCARAEGYAHHVLRAAIKWNALACALPARWVAERPAHLPSAREMQAAYADLPDAPGPFEGGAGGVPGALARTLAVADACRHVPPLGRVLFPAVELEPGETPYGSLCRLAFDGVQRRFRPLRPEVVRRLDHELSAIESLGYAPYFLLVRRIADFARARGIPCVGRGSAADSLVAYALGLTDADPIRYRLPFERFLNPARKDRPDIDLDFCWRRRDEVLEHVLASFGAHRTAMIATLNHCGLRAAFREAALAQGVPPPEASRWSRRLPWIGPGSAGGESGEAGGEPLSPEGEDGGGAQDDEARDDAGEGGEPAPLVALSARWRANPVARALAATPECRAFPFDDARWASVLEGAAALYDAPRHLGLHPGGVVVAPGALTEFVSCQRASKGVLMTQLDKDGVEAIGLVKMDLLGNRALTVVDDCVRLLAERGVAVDPQALPEDDPDTARRLVRGQTLGCSQVESPGMRHLLEQTGARTTDDVIQAIALIRPGPAGSGMKDAYVRRFRGVEAPEPPHPRLRELLWETHGVMLYQEDVMQAVVLLAGMSLAEADELRRALAKRRSRTLARLRARFLEGCAREGVGAEDAARVWRTIQGFASFGFCKAHAVTYGRLAYRTVWLKTHHPAAYLTAFLNSETGYYATRVYVEEARRMGVAILPPDVNRSLSGFRLEDGRRAGEPAAIRVGLARVKGLSQETLERLLREREERGPFLSLPDFLERTRAHADEAEHLVLCGAFDAFDRTRPEMLWRLHLLRAAPRRAPRPRAGEAALDQGLLDACRLSPEERQRRNAHEAARAVGWSGRGFGVGALPLAPGESASLFPEPPTPALALPALSDLDATTRGRLELELLGLGVSAHPTALFPAPADARLARARDAGHPPRPPPEVPCLELARWRERRVTLRGWRAASRRVRTRDGRWMRFLTLEDESGIAEAVLFPDVYERDGQLLAEEGTLVVSGRVEDRLGACALHVERVW